MLNITEAATAKIQEILAEENDPSLKIRAFVEGGGCSGFRYSFMIEDVFNEDDTYIESVVVDSMSMMYLSGSTIDYIDDINGSHFKINNPNAQSTCGCGSSFSV